MRLLLTGGCDPNAADYDKRTCLHLAASMGNLHVVQELLKHGADINYQDRWGGTPLADAMREGHGKVTSVLRESGGELKYSQEHASRELIEMSRQGDKERVLQLLQGGCPANSADYDGRTAMHLAAAFGNLHALKVLLEAGANPNSTDRWGRTPLADCIKEGHAEVAHALIEAGGQLLWDENTSSGELCELARGGDLEKIKLLLAGSCDPNAADYDKRTCLHLAASEGNLTVAEALCKHPKIDVNAKDRWDGTALADAVRCLQATPPPHHQPLSSMNTTAPRPLRTPFPGARGARQGGAAAARQRRPDVLRAGDHLAPPLGARARGQARADADASLLWLRRQRRRL